MRAAPPVDARLDPGVGLRRIVAALHVVAAAALLAWLHGRVDDRWPGGDAARLFAGLALPIGLVAAAAFGRHQARAALPPRERRLRWDGRGWWLVERGAAPRPLARADVMLDAGTRLWLRLTPAPHDPAGAALQRRGVASICARIVRRPASLWALASRAADPANWHALRVALHADAASAPAAQPVAETMSDPGSDPDPDPSPTQERLR